MAGEGTVCREQIILVGENSMKIFVKLAVIGIFSGLILGGFLKAVQQLTTIPVYVLLLNVDYFPVIQDWQMNEMQEFFLHMVVSVGLVIVLYVTLGRLEIHRKIHPYITMNVLIGGLLFLTTVLSDRTPALLDRTAFIYWMVGHLIYGVVVGILITKKD